MSATVYFSRTITPEKVLALYKLVGKAFTKCLTGKLNGRRSRPYGFPVLGTV